MRAIDPIPVLIFDLDGTILRSNSFPLWVVFLLIGRISGLGLQRRASLSMSTMRLLLSRKFGRLNHDELQRRLQLALKAAIGDCSLAAMHRFQASLSRRVRANLGSLLRLMVERQIDAVLATAAAAEYAEPLGRQLGFRHVLATRPDRIVGELANAGHLKRQRVADFLRDAGWHDRSLVLFTDHQDDLPLIRDSNVVYWFGSADMLARVRTQAAATRFIYCRDMSPEMLRAEVLALWDHPADSSVGCLTSSLSEMTLS
jgi:phosphoserine phosphatase